MATVLAVLFTTTILYSLLYLTLTVTIEYLHVRMGAASLVQGGNSSGIFFGATDEEIQV